MAGLLAVVPARVESRVEATSGLRGVVLLVGCGHQTPAKNCRYTPISRKVRVLHGGRVVAEVQARPHGHFRIALRPGSYTAVARAGLPGEHPGARHVVIRRERYTWVRLYVGNGVR